MNPLDQSNGLQQATRLNTIFGSSRKSHLSQALTDASQNPEAHPLVPNLQKRNTKVERKQLRLVSGIKLFSLHTLSCPVCSVIEKAVEEKNYKKKKWLYYFCLEQHLATWLIVLFTIIVSKIKLFNISSMIFHVSWNSRTRVLFKRLINNLYTYLYMVVFC